MTARDVIAAHVADLRRMAVEFANYPNGTFASTAAECMKAADELESTLAQPSGEAVAGWLVEWNCNGVGVAPSAAKAFTAAEEAEAREYHAWRNTAPDYNPARLSPLYTTPPAPLGGLTEGEREALLAEIASLRDLYMDAAVINKSDQDALQSAIDRADRAEDAIRRLTAPRAEGVDLPKRMENVRRSFAKADDYTEGRNEGYAQGWNDCLAALTAAAPKVGGNSDEVARLTVERDEWKRREAFAVSDLQRQLRERDATIDALRKKAEEVAVPQAEAGELEPAPPHNLPTWDECALRVKNSDYIAKRVAEGGYGPEADSMVANDLHRFIYEYDDADPFKSAWFMHRLELALAALHPAPASGGDAVAALAMKWRCESAKNITHNLSEYRASAQAQARCAVELEAALAPQRSERGE